MTIAMLWLVPVLGEWALCANVIGGNDTSFTGMCFNGSTPDQKQTDLKT